MGRPSLKLFEENQGDELNFTHENLDKRKTSNSLIEDLYAKYFQALISYLLASFGPGPPPPEDTAQQAFERLLKYERLDQIKNHKAFLWRIARNVAISEHRKQVTQNENGNDAKFIYNDLEGNRLTPECVLGSRRKLSSVIKMINNMPKQRRSAFILVRIDGLSHYEAAEKLDISRSAITKHVAYATAQISKVINDD